MSKKVVVIGGGIVGLSTAFSLVKSGHEVTVLERESGVEGCSFGNAGMIVPSHFVPLAAPGMVSMGLKMLLNPKSPFGFTAKPQFETLAWAWHFMRAATAQHVHRSGPILKLLNLRSREAYLRFAEELGEEFGLESKGLLMICKKESTLKHEAELATEARRLGLRAEVYEGDSLKRIETGIEIAAAGAVHFEDDCHLTPGRFMSSLRARLSESGVVFRSGVEVSGFATSEGKIERVLTSQGEFVADEVVLSAGAWTGQLAKLLGIKLPLLGGKGYGFTVVNTPQMPEICSILTEARVAVTPMLDGLRFTGTMELGPPSSSINQSRLAGIRDSIPKFFPQFRGFDLKNSPVWHGLRPCSPDGMPYIGRSSRVSNAVFATGHGMMGMSLGPVTGELVAEIINDTPTQIPLQLLNPDRYDS